MPTGRLLQIKLLQRSIRLNPPSDIMISDHCIIMMMIRVTVTPAPSASDGLLQQLWHWFKLEQYVLNQLELELGITNRALRLPRHGLILLFVLASSRYESGP